PHNRCGLICLLVATRDFLITYFHKPIKTVHHKEIAQFFVRIYKNDFPVDPSHPFEKAYDFAYPGTVDKRNQVEVIATSRTSFSAIMESRRLWRRGQCSNVIFPSI
ncbi:MAG: hypothetical protein P8Y80_16715, partial [Acidobacteriota bacterium]